jgi:transaldolase
VKESVLERLAETNPDLEIWWDSSPLVFESWVQKMLGAAAPERRDTLEAQLRRLYVAEDPASSLIRGCTTNPPLSLQAVEDDPAFWNAWIDERIAENPDITRNELYWSTYKEVVRRGAEMHLPIHESSGGRFGWISGQLDPRVADDAEAMVQGAEEISSQAPNVMIKVPGTSAGIRALKEVTSRAISTNVTVCFTLPQILAAGKAVWEGMQIAKEEGVDLSNWRSVITMMIGRLTEREALDVQAERRGIHLTRMDKHWFGLAVFKRAVRMLHDNGWPSKMLACSMRAGPLVAGKPRFWDVEFLAGGDIVYTMPPYVLEPLFEIGDSLTFRPDAIHEGVPVDVMDKMLKIPYVIQAYDPDGMALEQFDSHPATLYTVGGFSKASEGLEAYVGKRMELAREHA